MSLYDWLIFWLDNFEKKSIKKTTYANYSGHIHNHFVAFKCCPIDETTADDISDFYDAMEDSGLSPKTIRNMAMILRKALKKAVIEGLIKENYSLLVKLPQVPKKEILVLTHEQEDRLIRESYFHRFGVFIRLTLCTGLRLGEVLGLRWVDVDLVKGELKVRHILHRVQNFDPNCKNSTSVYLDDPKTEKSKRSIPLTIGAIEDLKQWLHQQQKEAGSCEFIVTYANGKSVDSAVFKKYYNRMLDRCGITGVTFHALRHTFATNALENGMDKKVLSEVLGHYSVAFTLDTYAHVLTPFKRKNMELMNDVYSQNKIRQQIVLSFKPFQDQYIVSIPGHWQYSFIAQNIQDGVDYVKKKASEIQLTQAIDVQKYISTKATDEIVICLG